MPAALSTESESCSIQPSGTGTQVSPSADTITGPHLVTLLGEKRFHLDSNVIRQAMATCSLREGSDSTLWRCNLSLISVLKCPVISSQVIKWKNKS